MKLWFSAMMAVTVSVPVQGKHSAAPLAPGLYCLKEPLTGFTGTGKDIPLGDFLMSVEIKRNANRYVVTFSNSMPDNPQILHGETEDASVLKDGSLAFTFTDGWENEGRARVYPSGKIVLVMTKEAPTELNQIGRNYGTYTVSKRGCSADDIQRLH